MLAPLLREMGSGQEGAPGKESQLSAQTRYPNGFLSKIIILGQTSCARWAPGFQNLKSNLANAGLTALSAGGAEVGAGVGVLAAASHLLGFAFGASDKTLKGLSTLQLRVGGVLERAGLSVPQRGREGLRLEPGWPLQGG